MNHYSSSAFLPAVIVAYYGGADILQELHRRNIESVRVQMPNHDKTNQFLIQYIKKDNCPSAHVVVQEKEMTVEALAQTLKTLGITHIIPSDEAGVKLTDQLCDLLGLPFNGMALSPARRNKSLMHQHVAKHGIRTPLQCTAESTDTILTWMHAHSLDFPIVVKPVDGAGSAGVTLCHSDQDISDAFNAIAAIAQQKKTVISIGDTVIAQECLRGTEYVVDTVSVNGVHKLTDIWQCTKGYHNGSAFVYEYFDLIDYHGDTPKRLYTYVCRILDALDITTGPSHAEIYITEDGMPTIVEVGFRIGGPRMPYGTAPCVASNKAQIEYTVDAYLEPSAFHDSWDQGYVRTKHSRMVFLISEQTDLFLDFSLDVLDAIRHLPSYYHEEFTIMSGDSLQETVDVRSSPGFIYLMHDDAAQIKKDYDFIRSVEKDLFVTSSTSCS